FGGGGWIRTNVGARPTDLQSAPFNHSGTPPRNSRLSTKSGGSGNQNRGFLRGFRWGAGTPNRTEDLPLTRRLLYQLSYAGTFRAAAPCRPPRPKGKHSAAAPCRPPRPNGKHG